jgi:hypothetical protein
VASGSPSRQTSNGREIARRSVAVAPDTLRVGPADVEADHAAHPRPFGFVRVVPVIDLKGGVAVHAVPRGSANATARSAAGLVAGADPVAVTRAVRDRLGLDELYGRGPRRDHRRGRQQRGRRAGARAPSWSTPASARRRRALLRLARAV